MIIYTKKGYAVLPHMMLSTIDIKRNSKPSRCSLARYIIFYLLLSFFYLNPVYSPASESGDSIQNNTASWDRASFQARQLYDNGECEEVWDVIWPIARNESSPDKYKARKFLLRHMYTLPHLGIIRPPGNAGDVISTERDALIFVFHSNIKSDDNVYGLAIDLLKKHFPWEQEGMTFYNCMHDFEQECYPESYVNDLTIPSFQEYAREIDALIEGGYGSTCLIIK